MNNENIINRILDVISVSTGNNKQKFADMIGINKTTVFRWLRGEGQPDIVSIIKRFPNINPVWLIHGIGVMRIKDELELFQWPYDEVSEWYTTTVPVSNGDEDLSCAPEHDIYNDEESRCEDELIDTLKQQVKEKDRQIAMLQKNITDLISNISK